jgi:hypothetical protein
MRQNMPFYTLDTVGQVMGVSLDIDPIEVSFFPSDVIRITLWYAGAQRMRQMQLQLTPNADKAKPWQIDYTLEFGLLPTYADVLPLSTQLSIFVSTLPTQTP